jgi:hypothetical protein
LGLLPWLRRLRLELGLRGRLGLVLPLLSVCLALCTHLALLRHVRHVLRIHWHRLAGVMASRHRLSESSLLLLLLLLSLLLLLRLLLLLLLLLGLGLLLLLLLLRLLLCLLLLLLLESELLSHHGSLG